MTVNSSNPSFTNDVTGNNNNNNHQISAWQEAKQLIEIAVPSIVVQVGAFVPSAWTASYIGRNLGTVPLAGFALATLTVNLCSLSILNGVYSASDTLSPRAFGAGNYQEVGLIAIRGFVASMLITVPINTAVFFYMEDWMLALGQSPEPSRLAAEWYRIYIFIVPFFALYSVQWKFLSAQEVMNPIVVASLLAVFVVLPVGLNTLVPTFGFLGSAAAFFLCQASQAMGLLLYVLLQQPYTPGTWPDLLSSSVWKQALAWKPFAHFLYLGFGGIVASSEWIWWEMVSLLIGTMGVLPQSTHAIPTQVLVTSFMLPYGIGIGLAIRIGNLLPHSVPRARNLAFWAATLSLVLFWALSWLMWIGRFTICAAFTKDDEVIEGALRIWWKVVLTYFNFCIFGVFTGISFGLGLQWTLGIATAVCMWLFSLPAIYWYAVVKEGGLDAAWTWIFPPYMVINVVLAVAFYIVDWDKIGRLVREKQWQEGEEETNYLLDDNGPATETTQLL